MAGRASLLLGLGLLAGCDGGGAGEANRADAAPAANVSAGAPKEKVLKSETVEAVFTGWEVGDYVWANLEVKGREAAGAWVGPAPLEHFLEAHKGKPITVRIDTVRLDVPEVGGEQDVPRIAEAKAGGLTAASWWQSLSPERRKAAERRMDEVLGGGA
ncbi:MAG TPA: hypothetical protein VGB59_06180 [Allosphingosinicella sp.]|jgi:hypothetical protein